jgi:RNA polymerase sigma factor (TIGR02999 family)
VLCEARDAFASPLRAQCPAMDTGEDITRLLSAWRNGDSQALSALTPMVYEELRRLAARYMRSENAGHTLQATALVHEAYARLAGADFDLKNRAHLLALMAQLMRQVLVDHARTRQAVKRGGGLEQVALDDTVIVSEDSSAQVLELDALLAELQQFDATKSRIVELRFFGGLTNDETAAALGISPTTLDRELRLAKAWLRYRMG